MKLYLKEYGYEKNAFICLGICVLLMMCGCAFWIAPVIPPQGGVLSSTKAPLDIDVNNTDMGSKVGKASSVAILGLFAFGDASTANAAQNGNIQIIKHMDYDYINILGLFQQFTTIVYGD